MKKIFYCTLVLLTAGCKEKYESPVISPVTGYLVVEGVINSGQGTTTIILSRTTKLDNRRIEYQQGAEVKVEGDDNSSYFLSETAPGRYSTTNLNLNNGRKYRLNIRTAGKQYLSDFTAVKNNPPIDSLSWKRENNGVQLYINTHDPLNNTHYYQWEYTETWEFHSFQKCELKYEIFKKPMERDSSYRVVYRDSTTFSYNPGMFYCWQSELSSNILVGSSAKLSKDEIYLPLTFIPPASWKLSVLYSINTRQYSLSKEGYEFLERMKKNTEATGSVFDAQPSELNGNIHCVSDPAEPVIGYINICPVQEKRIFIKNTQIPGWNYNSGCAQIEIQNISDSIKIQGLGLMPTYPALKSPFGFIISFYASAPDCVDCRFRGTNVKPSFWP